MLSQFFIIGGISIGGGRAPWAPPGYAYVFETGSNEPWLTIKTFLEFYDFVLVVRIAHLWWAEIR